MKCATAEGGPTHDEKENVPSVPQDAPPPYLQQRHAVTCRREQIPLNEAAILAGNARAADFANMLVEETGGRGMSGAVFDMCIHVYAADVEDISLEASRSEGADGWA